MLRVLVTGGNIGDHVAEMLVRRGCSVRLLVRRLTRNSHWDELGIQQVAADATDLDSLATAFNGVKRFFSVSPLVENLVELGVNAIEAAKSAGVRYIVRSSALGAGEKSITVGRLHREVEKAVEDSGIPYTILRPNTFMQSYLTDAETVKRDATLYMPMGSGRVSLIDVRDVAAVAITCLEEPGHEGNTYELTGGEPLSNFDIAEKLSAAVGKRIVYLDVSPTQAAERMRKARISEWMIQMLLELFDVCKAGYAAEISGAVEHVLKRKPISFDQFLAENGTSFRESDMEMQSISARR